MITGLDHVLIVCPLIDEAEDVYSALLGREPDWQANDAGGSATIIYQLENMALEIMAPQGGGPLARRLHSMIENDGAGLKSLIFASDNLADDRTAFERRALKPDEITPGESASPMSTGTRFWSRFRLDEQATNGVRIFVLNRKSPDPMVYKPGTPAAISGLDHVVINTPNPDRAAALYGARLGLRLALDRSNPDWDMRLMFFRVGGITVEVAHKISGGIGNPPDKLWGLSWKTANIEATHDRLMSANIPVTSIRAGRRAGTKVFSVRDRTLGVPTLVLAES